MTIDTDFLTVSQAADVLGVSTQTIKRRIKDGTYQAEQRPLPGGGGERYIWVIHRAQIEKPTQIVEVVPFNKPVQIDDIKAVLAETVAAENAALKQDVSELKAQITLLQLALTKMNENVQALTAGAKENPPQQKSWWKFWA